MKKKQTLKEQLKKFSTEDLSLEVSIRRAEKAGVFRKSKPQKRSVAKKEMEVCIFCGGKSPNPYGECFCSYEIDCFQSPKIYKLFKKYKAMAINLDLSR